MKRHKSFCMIFALMLSLSLVACGGAGGGSSSSGGGAGGGSSSSGGSAINTSTTVTGQLQASYINGVNICVNDGSIGTASQNCDTTKNQGNFSLADAVGKNLAVLIDTVLLGTMPGDKVSETTIITPAAMSGGDADKAQRITDIFHQAGSTADNQTYDIGAIRTADIDAVALSAFIGGTINTLSIGRLKVTHDSVGTYTITGKVTLSGAGLSGVTVSLTGASTTSTTTDSDGNYSFSGAQNGSYTVTPSMVGYTFTPASRSVSISAADSPGNNFTAVVITYSITGTLSGAVKSGVTISLTGTSTTSATTDANGSYSFTGAQNGSYTVTPSLTGYTFSPASRSVTVNGANLTGQDFTATLLTYSISGTVSGAVKSGVTITLSGDASGITTTDSNGNYSFSGVVNGSYTITLSKTGYIFTPSTTSIIVNNAAVTVSEITAGIYVPPHFAYVANSQSGTISVFTINQTTGALTPGAAVAAGAYPCSVTVHPSKKFAYAANETSNTISVYTIDQTTGALTPGAAVAAGTSPMSITVHPSGKFAYAANGASYTISVYTIDQTTGALTPGIAVAAGTSPCSVAVDQTGKFAYAANFVSNTISAYTIDQTTGALTPGTAVSIYSGPYTIQGPMSITVHPSGKFAYTANGNLGSITVYSINQTTGALTMGTSWNAGAWPNSVTIDPSGKFAYAANLSASTISVHTIDQTTGALTAGTTVASGAAPYAVTVSPSGKFAYAVNSGSNNISVYNIDQTTGELTAGTDVAAETYPTSITTMEAVQE